MAGSFTITGFSATEPAGQRTFGPLSIQGTVIIGQTIEMPLVMGDNTFVVPGQSVACLIIPPENGEAVLKLRTNLNSGDAGLPISNKNLMVYSLSTPLPTALIVNSSAAVPAPITLAFI